MRSSKLKALKQADSKETPTHSWNQIRDLSFSPCPSLFCIQPASERCWSTFPCAGAAPVLHGAEALLLSENARSEAVLADPQEQAQTYRSWPGPVSVSAWQSCLPLPWLTEPSRDRLASSQKHFTYHLKGCHMSVKSAAAFGEGMKTDQSQTRAWCCWLMAPACLP